METKKKSGFSRLSVEPKKKERKENREFKEKHQDDLMFMKLYLGNRRCLWLPLGISPELLKSYIDAVSES